jgi:sulfide:quinone oxidoreductase
MGQTIVVLGAGIGGAYVARELRAELGSEHRVIVVDRSRDLVFSASLPWLLVGQRERHEITRPLHGLERYGIEVQEGEIDRIDPERRELVVSGSTTRADHIVIALGAELAPELVPGLEAVGCNLYEIGGVERLKRELASLDRGRLVLLTATPAYKCPAAPYEFALLIEHDLRRRQVREAISMELWAAEPAPMGVAGPEVSKAVRAMVESQGILYRPGQQVVEVDAHRRVARFVDGGETPFDVLGYVPPHRAPLVLRAAGLVEQSGWIVPDRTLATRFPGVWAIGDVVMLPLKMGKPLPKAGVFAVGMGQAVVSAIVAAVRGKGEVASFDGYGECFVEVGGGVAARGFGRFLAEPLPEITLEPPSTEAHEKKLAWEQECLSRWS